MRPDSAFRLLALVTFASSTLAGCAEWRQWITQTDERMPVVLTPVEASLYLSTNQFRVTRGLSALTPDTRLVAIARSHCQDLAGFESCSNEPPNGVTVFGLLREARFPFHAAGSNIQRNLLPLERVAESAFTEWLLRPESLNNLTHATYRRMGVGCALGRDGAHYVNAVFTD